ncbi:MAG: hypothetical protein WA631_10215 [Nitrososphaeraceae archaeon]
MMITGEDCLIDILSKECKANEHNTCHGKWLGFGFEVVCRCGCGHRVRMQLKQEQASN